MKIIAGIGRGGERHESKITAFASKAMRFNERADDNEAKIARVEEKLPALNARIDGLSKQLNQVELELLEPQSGLAINAPVL